MIPVAVIGGGPAGLAAAWAAARAGAQVRLFERQPETGRKLLLTGNGQCNVTHGGEMEAFYPMYFGAGRFLRPAFSFLDNAGLLELLRRQGLLFRDHGEGKIFPDPPRAADVRDAWVRAAAAAGAHIVCGTPVRKLERREGRFLLFTAGRPDPQEAASVILTTGGRSYPATGSTGDGYRWAADLGVPVTVPRPALAPLRIRDKWCRELAGITLDHAALTLLQKNPEGGRARRLGSASGALLFTHTGLSGPAALRLARDLPPEAAPEDLELLLQVLPEETPASIAAQMDARFHSERDRHAVRMLAGLLPRALAARFVALAGGIPDQPVKTQSPRLPRRLADLLHRCPLSLDRLPSFGQAMVTAGGIRLNAVDPRTLRVRDVAGLYAAGEVLDIDGDTGGYNLQAAFSTGALAGCRAAEAAAGASPRASASELLR